MSNSRGGIFGAISPVTRHLLIINVLMWLATIVLKGRGIDLNEWLGLHYWQAQHFNAAQLITYMFMHDTSTVQGGISHLFFNMFSLWMFGSTLERVMGQRRFLTYYLICGLGAGLVQELVWTLSWQSIFVPAMAQANGLTTAQVQSMLNSPQMAPALHDFYNMLITVGASGAVFGILLAFGMLFPNLPLYIIPFPFPIKAKWMVLGYGVVELLFGVTGAVSGVAHFAHLGGMLFGFFVMIYWKKKGVFGGGNGYY